GGWTVGTPRSGGGRLGAWGTPTGSAIGKDRGGRRGRGGVGWIRPRAHCGIRTWEPPARGGEETSVPLPETSVSHGKEGHSRVSGGVEPLPRASPPPRSPREALHPFPAYVRSPGQLPPAPAPERVPIPSRPSPE